MATLADVLPGVQALSRVDKLRLIQFLAQGLAGDESASALEAGQSYPVWSPATSVAAAEVLLEALEGDRGRP